MVTAKHIHIEKRYPGCLAHVVRGVFYSVVANPTYRGGYTLALHGPSRMARGRRGSVRRRMRKDNMRARWVHGDGAARGMYFVGL